mmetsp:Transcript_14116/g.20590  ORF Transcript_14116/g.20590 Transcript_14116/m.20590 type:complete len:334 (-) Transcript_14116:292-1293(-)
MLKRLLPLATLLILSVLVTYPSLIGKNFMNDGFKDVKCMTEGVAQSNSQNVGKGKVEMVETGLSVPCEKKYILLTTQRSGSTWTCTLLHQLDGISCGGRPSKIGPVSELLIQYSRKDLADVIWSTYKKHLDNAFAEVCQYHPSQSIGFKLMYDQIPPQFLEDGNLETYMRENGVSFLHLVREAKILKMASSFNNSKEKPSHSTNATAVKELRGLPKLPWNDKTIDNMLNIENISADWQKKIRFMPLVPEYYLSYESLLNKEDRLNHIRQITVFLTNENLNPNATHINGTLFQLHEPLCSDRVENYTGFRMHHKVRESRSAAACDMIEFYFGGK